MKTHLASILIVSFILALVSAGCANPLRLAPTEPQKQITFRTHLNALAVNSSGAEANTPATKQLVEGTAASLDYAGQPANPDITDYTATLSAARSDAVRRPTIEKISGGINEGLSLVAQIALAFGVGGSTLGGKKLLDWVKLAKVKNKALTEIIQGNEFLKSTLTPAAINDFKSKQSQAQSISTEKIVKDIKLGD